MLPRCATLSDAVREIEYQFLHRRMWALMGNPMPAALPNRDSILRKAAAESGDPRSEVNRNGLGGFCSRFNRRSERSISPWILWVDGSLPFNRRMWIVPSSKFKASQVRFTSSPIRRHERKASEIMTASRKP